ncbi:sigma-54 interaction domain-containing protein [Aneurinibacillus thermoaerophilus]|uniref:sigma-54 interaction domain-containing protein n=1 Tax=Aneurinibacillus thermoaerophilus TaxID=143495 RepID=UPI002E231581|nr:sigma 54-interacting transcriptional regulator [Aneurinibacillus thermoaerophilus]MED0679017.1 sigma 54-interacting transcriptional regulator [Aneurinibacillus thermoaerophilus]MED0736554.1 sigma 54-interacting transcriptional regulator [Aneurinibacillus thermoaerophilus]MED0756058.1 sigma 54-interacting transcriptional regulator [Aneurinibacillus thermoaerophilus]MED0759618.1 sigma 54-interacting transcriptional regulator [Aneurinibacillus thermoaerophilus]MED0764731.1 sigma 54-interacting
MQRTAENNKQIEISAETLMNILDHSSDEIFVLDKEGRIIYVNKVCERHYGLKPSEVIGKTNDEFVSKGYWSPSIVPFVLTSKKPITIKQTTYIGGELITTAIPILNKDNEIELIVTTSQEQNYKKLQMPDTHEKNDSETEYPSSKNLITNNKEMKKLIAFCEKVAKVDTTLLIQGESGTGKSVLAKYIHQMSTRKNGPFLSLNCAAIPEELLESELFGYVHGAFTGASKGGKMGLLEAANGGTVFLDEIGEISPKMQAKLLQVIQERQFFPVGGREAKKLDIRIITATNQNLYEMVQEKRFREDLYYRLNVIEIKLPPLRERVEDIIPLTYYFLNKFNKKYEVYRLISQKALDIIFSYDWPGNVRQLENVIERLVVTTDSIIEVEDLPDTIVQNAKPKSYFTSSASLDEAIEELEKNMVINSYQKNKSSRKVAKDLQISQTRACKLIRKYCRTS